MTAAACFFAGGENNHRVQKPPSKAKKAAVYILATRHSICSALVGKWKFQAREKVAPNEAEMLPIRSMVRSSGFGSVSLGIRSHSPRSIFRVKRGKCNLCKISLKYCQILLSSSSWGLMKSNGVRVQSLWTSAYYISKWSSTQWEWCTSHLLPDCVHR
jgi:hypothetical protein